MQASFYEKLQRDLVMIRHLHDPSASERGQYDRVVSSLREARRKIDAHSRPQERKILLYCIDTLFEIMDEGDAEKVFDFADAVHNIPEIYLQKRNLYSFRRELNAFRKKYGKRYFAFIDEVKPRFTEKAPKNTWEFFFAASDVDFRILHPVGYVWLCIIGITALMLPQIIYIAYCVFINPAPNEWPMIMGYVGAFMIGAGLFNIAAAWIHQYLGHFMTIACLLGGSALAALSLYMLYG